jgi:hypothetical protein
MDYTIKMKFTSCFRVYTSNKKKMDIYEVVSELKPADWYRSNTHFSKRLFCFKQHERF